MRLGRRTHTPFFVSLFPSFLTQIFPGITMLRLLQKRLFSSPAALCFSLSPMSAFSRSLAAGKVLPSSPEMKTPAWAESESNESAITKKVVGLARSLQETGRPPISIAKNFSKNFVAGQLYDPFDFSMDRLDMEAKWEKRRRDPARNYRNGENDVFVRTGIDPLDLYSMPEILSRFVSSTGQILPREVTGCNAKNQKKLGIAIKRARSVGLLSTTHRHARYMPKRIL